MKHRFLPAARRPAPLYSTPLFTAPAVPAALLIGAGLSGGLESGVVALLAGGGAFTIVLLLPGAVREGIRFRTLRLRIMAGILLGVCVIVFGLFRIYAPRTRFTSGLAPGTIVTLEGRLLHDLRPGSSPYRVIELEALAVGDQRGWRSPARGRVKVIWQGDEYVRADRSRVIPVRGDVLRLRGLTGIERWAVDCPPMIRVDPERMVLSRAQGVPAARRAARDWVRRRLARLDPRGGAMLPALLLGDRGALARELTDAVRASGASHVLALSGMHLGVLAVILHLGPARFLSRRARTVVVLPVLFVYVWVAGWIPSLVRALVLITLASIARFRGRSVPVPLLLARTVVITGFVAPRIAGSLGFQLSLLALAGIVLLSPRVADELGRAMPRAIAAYIGVTVAAMFATAPVSLRVFGSVYPAGIVLAGVLSLLIVLQMWAGLLFLLVTTVPVVGTLVARLAGLNASLIHRVADLGYFFPVIRIDPEAVPLVLVTVIVVIAGSGSIVLWWRGRKTGGVGEPQLDF